ncbi:hypothetical protein NDK47_05980 [Brevibacillus ruminantium]|uniref:LTXXQ motif family protein n=1 Tax=Brevibacillus ruminantium TaxID=2950604 RepID=A0ABY4WIC4_9BACL|nr:hypothetical protein [Brevibacillus ruminantium]USG66847.1 hypothetical protein NDK47_05980 [Brevibacillus ruminantium]
MKHWKNSLFAAVLLVGLTVPTWVQAEGAQPEVPVSETGQYHEHGEHHQGHEGSHKYKGHLPFKGVHRQMYMTLLAEKYTPESVNEWKAALAEQKRLKDAYRAQRENKKENPAQKPEQRTQQMESWRALKEKHREIHKEFHAAIESGDAAKIKEVMPKLLAEVKEVNTHLAKKLGEKKK